MIKKFKSRAAGVLSVGIVALALGAAGAAPTPISASPASTSGLTPKQKKAKKKALKRCYKIKKKAKRKKCVKNVNKRFKPKPPKARLAATIGVHDDYFDKTDLTIKKGESLKWVWDNSNRNAHNVTLKSGPSGLSAKEIYGLSTPNSPAVQYTFGPKVLSKPGEYDFYCTLHSTVMEMKVKVTK